MIKRNLDKRLPLTHSVKMATLLDPSTRALLELSDDVMEDMLYAATAAYTGCQPPVVDSSNVGSSIAASTPSSSCNIDISATPLSKKMKLFFRNTTSRRKVTQISDSATR